MGTWGKDCGERWLPGTDLMEDGGNLVVLKILTTQLSIIIFSFFFLLKECTPTPSNEKKSGFIVTHLNIPVPMYVDVNNHICNIAHILNIKTSVKSSIISYELFPSK